MVNKVFVVVFPISVLFFTIMTLLIVAMAINNPYEGCDRQSSDQWKDLHSEVSKAVLRQIGALIYIFQKGAPLNVFLTL
jgi:hypothetical protein